MTAPLLAVIAVLTIGSQALEWPTLRDVLRKNGIDAARLEDADQPITSYAVGVDESWVGIAYYWHQGNDVLPRELRIRTLNRKTGAWRRTIIDRDNRRGGSALRIANSGGWIFLDLHITPSAGELFVLSSNLTVRRRLSGWSSVILEGGRVVYEHSMIHFAPFHRASVGLYDAKTNGEDLLYPATLARANDKRLENRSVQVRGVDRRRVIIEAVEQDLRWVDNARTEPLGPERRITVRCDVSATHPRCVRTP